MDIRFERRFVINMEGNARPVGTIDWSRVKVIPWPRRKARHKRGAA